jgi:hypothetical protein
VMEAGTAEMAAVEMAAVEATDPSAALCEADNGQSRVLPL